MSKFHSNETIHIKSITLLIKNMERSIEFYVDILGCSILSKEKHTVVLTANQIDPLITLIEDRNALPLEITLGLYHFAFLLPNKKAIALMIKQLIEKRYPISGASDHGVSEALYLDDPDGNGIEIYYDRDEEMWPYEHGSLTMYTKKMDMNALLGDLSEQDKFTHIHPETIIGHLHFHVSNLEEASLFYADGLGFEHTMQYLDSALFMASSGYHHHLGVNTWNRDAPLPKEKQVGLKSYVLHIPNQERSRLLRRLSHMHIPIIATQDQSYVIDILGQKVYF